MLNFDNTVNYAPSFKKIDESIESINTLLTSLLLDTYTNQTFIYSDINVIRVNTSQNYDSIQSLSAGLPMKLDSSLASNFFMNSNSDLFASMSTLSDKFDASDSTNFLTLSNSTLFASTSTLSDKLNASDSSLFALESDFESQISEKLNITDFNIYSLDFASTSTLSDKFNDSDSTLFALSSELTSKLNLSDSTFFLPSSDYSTQVQVSYLSKLTDLVNTYFSINLSSLMFSVNGNIYNLEQTTVSNMGIMLDHKQLLNGFDMWSNSIDQLDSNTIVANVIKNNTFKYIGQNSIYGIFQTNTFSKGYGNTFRGRYDSNIFSNQTNIKIKCNTTSFSHNTLAYCTSVIIDCSRSDNIRSKNIESNLFSNVLSMKIKNADLYSNTFSVVSCCTLDNIGLYSNKFSLVQNTPLHIKLNENYSNSYLISANTFYYCNSITFDIYNTNNAWTTQTNAFDHVDYVEFNIGPNVNIDLRKFLALRDSCTIGGININLSPGDDRKTMFETQLGYYGVVDFVSNLKSISFNSTNDWINSGFRKTLSSEVRDPNVLDGYYNGSRLNVQGSISTSTGYITNLNRYYFQPKFSPNYNSLKHYMVLYGDSFRDYFELDPHALEAGHNNNACENILLQKDYTFYSTLTTEAGKDSYTFIQWPSTELVFPKSDYSNNTLLNTISDITKYADYQGFYLSYTFGNNISTWTTTWTRLSSSLFSNFLNTSSSSQIYAGFSYSGLLTGTASTHRPIK